MGLRSPVSARQRRQRTAGLTVGGLFGLFILSGAWAQTLHGGVSVNQEVPSTPARTPAVESDDSDDFDSPIVSPNDPAGAIGAVLGGILGGLLAPGAMSSPQRYDMSVGQVFMDAQLAANAIDQAAKAGSPAGDPTVNGALARLRDDQVQLPPNLPRPASCYGILIGAWVAAQQHRPASAQAQTSQALACYRNAEPSSQPNEETAQCAAPPPNLQQQMMATAAALDQVATGAQNFALAAADSFTRGMSAAVEANLRWLAQARGVPVSQAAQALVSYLTTDTPTNHARLYQAAVQAVGAFQRDPAQFLGEQAGNAAFGAALGAAGGVAGRLCSGAARELAAVSQSLQAGERLLGLAEAEQRFGQAFQADLQRAQSAGGVTNPCFAENACFPTALARAELWREQTPFEVHINGVYATGSQDLRTTPAQISERLRALYGESFTPRNSQAYTAQQLTDIANGVPIAANAEKIEQILMQSGEGSQGLVFVRYKPEVLIVPDQPAGHVFNVRLHAGKIEWVDETIASRDPTPNFKWMESGFFYPVQ